MIAATARLRVVVVDDSALYRKVVRDVLESLPEVEVVGTAINGRQALAKIIELKPDVVTLDLEMPELDGIGVLRELQSQPQPPLAIMVSAFTARGAQSTTAALQLGAFDFILKPTTNSLEESVAQLKRDLSPKIHGCRSRMARPSTTPNVTRPVTSSTASTASRPKTTLRPEIIAIGVSTGGPKALSALLPMFPANLRCPIVLVQHMPPLFTKSLAEDLNKRCALEVLEAVHGQPVKVGQVLIAPGGKQMRIVDAPGGKIVQITDDAVERNCKPSVDYLFRSVANAYGSRTLGVILTGMGDDGTLGCADIKRAGGSVYTQDEASCVVYGMPRSVVEKDLSDLVAPLEAIHQPIISLVNSGLAHERALS
jgi:two-component system, chemotaxis family, protein-glutamate methylesterase/glutaminase